ncbi:MAG: MBOAT family protein [Phycisphaerales bacterium]|nr:MBOAT family protein [Phycisphaerales bacterium]
MLPNLLFNSVTFAVFLLIVYVAYVATMRRLRLQNAMLLVASYVFYGWWDWRFLSLLLLSTVVDYGVARVLDARRGGEAGHAAGARGTDAPPDYRLSPRARRAVQLISVAANLGLLGFFKYYDFFAASLTSGLQSLGVTVSPLTLGVILPVGISFYTFQTLSYTIDVYRGDLPAHRSLVEFALFVAFFPQLVAGPIVRAADLLPQIAAPRRLDLQQTYDGGLLIFWGLFKKLALADSLAPLVDNIFSHSASHNGGGVLLGVYGFALQIYCDFSGYTDIARGCSKLMGFELMLNFNVPYLASNPVEFWRRWHISLSQWLRDYLYIPLGGSRRGPRRAYVNLMITMILGGLWHGAAWTFVVWGVYQGALLVAYKAAQPWWAPLAARCEARLGRVWRVLCICVFFQFVCLGWLIFRAESLEQIGSMLTRICQPWLWWWLHGAVSAPRGSFVVVVSAMLLICIQSLQRGRGEDGWIRSLPVPVRSVVYAVLLLGLASYGMMIERPFVYFQF